MSGVPAPVLEAPETPEALVPIGGGGSVRVRARDGGASILIREPSGRAAVEIEIEVTERGPVVRARAASLAIEAHDDIVVRSDRLRVEAREIAIAAASDLRLSAGAGASVEAADITLRADPGDVRVRANDDVQLLGERVLLNAEPEPEVPAWAREAAPPPATPATLPVADVSGDPALAARFLREGG